MDITTGISIKRSDGTVEWSPCWIWIGDIDRFGYGRICLAVVVKGQKKKRPRNRQAHRVSYFAHKGLSYFPKTPILMHQCDRTNCIHPDHVDPGTHLLNMREMVERGRHGNRWGNAANNYGREPGSEP